MTSQLNVDTIVDKAGSGGTNVKIANTSVTVAEGGSATTNTVQGLAKLWCKFDQVNSNAINDSFNLASVTDTAGGRYSLNFTNNMANANYSTVGTSHHTANYYGVSTGPHTGDGLSTSLYAMRTITPANAGALADMSEISDSAFGDLA